LPCVATQKAHKQGIKIIDSSAENLTGLKQSTDIVLVKIKWIQIYLVLI
jgi:hypothetical protein